MDLFPAFRPLLTHTAPSHRLTPILLQSVSPATLRTYTSALDRFRSWALALTLPSSVSSSPDPTDIINAYLLTLSTPPQPSTCHIFLAALTFAHTTSTLTSPVQSYHWRIPAALSRTAPTPLRGWFTLQLLAPEFLASH